MKVELIIVDGKAAGWTIKGETDREKQIVNTIRDLSFWGFDETRIVYNGRSEYTDEDAGRLYWIQWQHKTKIRE